MKNSTNQYDPISPWFVAAEGLGEYIGIRFGRLSAGKSEPEWTFLRHADYDGVGGFVHLLRRHGVKIDSLPEIKHPAEPSPLALLRLAPKFLKPKRRVEWSALGNQPAPSGNGEPKPPTACAWHVFDESETRQLKLASQKDGITVNSLLVDTLTKGIRPFLADQSATVPWMIPINLRGKVERERDTANFASYIGIQIKPGETTQSIHRQIYAAMDRKEHWANWDAYKLGRFSSHGIKKFLIDKELAMSQWNLGSFSNLGVWDPEKQIREENCLGDWLFCPPVLRCQRIGAGCITFQNRLSLTIQAHPELTTSSRVCNDWIHSWVKQIKLACERKATGS